MRHHDLREHLIATSPAGMDHVRAILLDLGAACAQQVASSSSHGERLPQCILLAELSRELLRYAQLLGNYTRPPAPFDPVDAALFPHLARRLAQEPESPTDAS